MCSFALSMFVILSTVDSMPHFHITEKKACIYRTCQLEHVQRTEHGKYDHGEIFTKALEHSSILK